MSPSDDRVASSARASGTPRDNDHTPNRRPDGEYASLSAIGMRLTWAFAGPMAVLAYLAWLSSRDVPIAAPASVAFFGVVAVLVAARFVDVARFDGQTTTGERATRADAQRYAFTVVGLSSAAWLGVQVL